MRLNGPGPCLVCTHSHTQSILSEWNRIVGYTRHRQLSIRVHRWTDDREGMLVERVAPSIDPYEIFRRIFDEFLFSGTVDVVVWLVLKWAYRLFVCDRYQIWANGLFFFFSLMSFIFYQQLLLLLHVNRSASRIKGYFALLFFFCLSCTRVGRMTIFVYFFFP